MDPCGSALGWSWTEQPQGHVSSPLSRLTALTSSRTVTGKIGIKDGSTGIPALAAESRHCQRWHKGLWLELPASMSCAMVLLALTGVCMASKQACGSLSFSPPPPPPPPLAESLSRQQINYASLRQLSNVPEKPLLGAFPGEDSPQNILMAPSYDLRALIQEQHLSQQGGSFTCDFISAEASCMMRGGGGGGGEQGAMRTVLEGHWRDGSQGHRQAGRTGRSQPGPAPHAASGGRWHPPAASVVPEPGPWLGTVSFGTMQILIGQGRWTLASRPSLISHQT